MTTFNMGRQFQHIPAAAGLFFAGIFATLHHIAWLPLAVLMGAALLLVETQITVDAQHLRVCARWMRVTLRCRSWALADMAGAVLVEFKDATQYTSHSIRNTVRAHSFILTVRMPSGDSELYEFSSRDMGQKVLNVLAAHNVKTS
ncbi:MAG: hypothetical protein P8H88_07525 [Flavobacteriales bacterium]|nr:hypothetical protein [Flavobacteriales bacterium]